MPFVNRLEPEALLRHFMTYPPRGFVAARSAHGVPTFTARFDLLTTVDPALQHRLRSLPGFRLWRGVLQPRVCFVGSTVCEYAWLPGTMDPTQLARDLIATHARHQPFLIVKDLPAASPLLSPAENAWNDAFATACVGHGFVLLDGQALAWVPIDFDSVSAYLAALSRAARRDIRRKLRARDALQIDRLAAGDARFSDPAFISEIHQLYDNVYVQSELKFDYLDARFFRAVLQDAGCGGMLFTYRHAGRLIGWNLCFEFNGMLLDKYVGFVYPEARAFNLYAISWMHNLEYARQRGLRCFVAGWTDPEVKAHLGARMTFTRHAVRPRSRALRLALRHCAGLFESDRHWFEERADATGRA